MIPGHTRGAWNPRTPGLLRQGRVPRGTPIPGKQAHSFLRRLGAECAGHRKWLCVVSEVGPSKVCSRSRPESGGMFGIGRDIYVTQKVDGLAAEAAADDVQ